MQQRENRARAGAAVLALAAYLLAAPASAQVITATISGIVTDPSGAAVPNTTVTATNTETGLSRNSTANSEGKYTIPFLPVGRYSVKAEAPGFKSLLRENIELTVDQTATVDLALSVGEASESVTVSENASVVQTASAQMGMVVESKRMVELPLGTRNVLGLVALLPGVNSAGSPRYFTTARFGPTFIVNGSRSSENAIFMDGTLFEDLFRGTGLNVPPPDHLQEFRVVTNAFAAEYGRVPGGVINGITKSGTNEFHGGIYHFFDNEALNARPYFNPTKPKLRINQFGGTAGGPVIRNKVFFFFGYEGIRDRSAASATSALPPTSQEKQGMFTRAVLDPLSGQPFPDNTIPPIRFDKVAKAVLDRFIPTAPAAGAALVAVAPQPVDNNQYTGKGDWQLSEKHRIFVRYFQWNSTQSAALARSTNVLGYSATTQSNTIHNAVAGLTSVLSPTVVNEVRAGYHRTENLIANQSTADLNSLGGNYPHIGVPPFISVSGRFSLEPEVTTLVAGNIYQLADTVSLTRGRHTVKFGGQAWDQRSLYRCDYLTPSFASFTGSVTRVSNVAQSGDAFADFLLGRPESFSTNQPALDVSVNGRLYGLFAQDDWRIHPRLTLNLGLRWDLQMPWRPTAKNQTQFRQGQQSKVFPAAPVGLVFEGDPGVPDGFIHVDTNNFQPRLGIAWDVFGTQKTVVRTAFGVFTSRINGNHFAWAANQPFNVSRTFFNVTSYSDPLAGQPSIFPSGTSFQLPVGPVFADPNIVNPYTMNFNFQVEQQVLTDLAVEVAYVGKLGRKLMQAVDFNPAIPGPGATIANTEARRAILPGIYTLGVEQSSRSNSSYHALQVQATKRYSRGVAGSFAYTFSKAIDVQSSNTENDINSNPFFWDSDRGRSNFDRTHVVAASLVWEIPGVSTRSVFVRQAINGWQISPIFTYRSGPTVDFSNGSDIARVGSNRTGRQRPNIAGNPTLSHPTRGDAILRYFDRNAFQLPAVGTFGNLGRNVFYGPAFFQADLGLYKNFALRERLRLQYRAELLNAFNNVNLNAPATNISASNFGRITGAQMPRNIQMALKLTF